MRTQQGMGPAAHKRKDSIMARLTYTQKTQRVLQFMVGIRNRRARRAMAAHGFTEEDFDDGFDRLKATAKTRMDAEPEEVDPRLVHLLDQWENRWYPVIEAVLRFNFPDVYERVFRNLRQTEGLEVIVTVGTLMDRLDTIGLPADEGGLAEGPDALALLDKRGVKEDVLGEARGLLDQIGSLEEDDPEVRDEALDEEAQAAAEARLWAWYLEWSAIARSAIRDRRLLRSLGFLRATRRADGTLVDEVVEDDEAEEDVVVTPPVEPTPTA